MTRSRGSRQRRFGFIRVRPHAVILAMRPELRGSWMRRLGVFVIRKGMYVKRMTYILIPMAMPRIRFLGLLVLMPWCLTSETEYYEGGYRRSAMSREALSICVRRRATRFFRGAFRRRAGRCVHASAIPQPARSGAIASQAGGLLARGLHVVRVCAAASAPAGGALRSRTRDSPTRAKRGGLVTGWGSSRSRPSNRHAGIPHPGPSPTPNCGHGASAHRGPLHQMTPCPTGSVAADPVTVSVICGILRGLFIRYPRDRIDCGCRDSF